MSKIAAIILAAGVGGRFLPASKSINKCMMPLGNKPVIHYLVEECKDAGIDDIIITIPLGEDSIPKYFEEDDTLRQALIATGKPDYYERFVEGVVELGKSVRFCPITYSGKRGSAVPVQQAIEMVGEDVDKILIMYGDGIVAREGTVTGELKAAMQSRSSENENLMVGFEVSLEDREKYGVFMQSESDSSDVSIVEKPPRDVSPSSLTANLGWYLVPRSIQDHLENIEPDAKSGEYFLTDAINESLVGVPSKVHNITGTYLDCGKPDTWLAANNFIAEMNT